MSTPKSNRMSFGIVYTGKRSTEKTGETEQGAAKKLKTEPNASESKPETKLDALKSSVAGSVPTTTEETKTPKVVPSSKPGGLDAPSMEQVVRMIQDGVKVSYCFLCDIIGIWASQEGHRQPEMVEYYGNCVPHAYSVHLLQCEGMKKYLAKGWFGPTAGKCEKCSGVRWSDGEPAKGLEALPRCPRGSLPWCDAKP